MGLEDWGPAENSLRQAIAKGPRNAIPRVNLASLLARRGLHEESARLYAEATRISPGLGPAWRGLGAALSELQRPDKARNALKRALELNPRDRSAKTLLNRLP